MSMKCRICNKEDSRSNLILPCKCDGYVHDRCIDDQRSNSLNPESYYRCGVCYDKYLLHQIRSSAYSEAKQKLFRYLLIRDVVSLIGLTLIVLFMIASIVQWSRPDLNFLQCLGSVVATVLVIMGLFTTIVMGNIHFMYLGNSRNGRSNCFVMVLFGIIGLACCVYYIGKFVYYSYKRHRARLGLNVMDISESVLDKEPLLTSVL